ncbi:MAG: hypothetical protein MUP76_06810, partial [Acidimicrobiia bacterium]|nr:hypothetical protein [Acidimicrobiia bacterium]
MEPIRTARFGAPLITALAVLVAACTAPAGAGVPGVTGVTGVTNAPVSAAESDAPPDTVATTAPVVEPPREVETVEASGLPDITARPISIEELTAMLPTGETGPASTEGRITARRTNEA